MSQDKISRERDALAIEGSPVPLRDSLLIEREKTHGSFPLNAAIWQSICILFSKTSFQNDAQRLAANMIFLKLARMAQTPNVKDHWDDIAGYAKLGAEACE